MDKVNTADGKFDGINRMLASEPGKNIIATNILMNIQEWTRLILPILDTSRAIIQKCLVHLAGYQAWPRCYGYQHSDKVGEDRRKIV